MDTPTILGASLSFSVVSLPIIFNLYIKNISKDMALLKSEIRNEFKLEDEIIRKELELKLQELSSLIHSLKNTTVQLSFLIEQLEEKK
tara:strand:- start:116 stop:379 length:264 start_codon:yes stop_codon:yes gene_type:complete